MMAACVWAREHQPRTRTHYFYTKTSGNRKHEAPPGRKRTKGPSNRQSIATMRSFSLAIALLGTNIVCLSSAFATSLAGGAIHR